MADMAEIDLNDEPQSIVLDDGTVVTGGDVIVVDFDPTAARIPHVGYDDHYANLADVVEENDLSRIADDLLQAIEQDKESRKDWESRYAKGIRLTGITDDPSDGPFPGASRAVHPMLMEAGVQFQARAIAEAFPPEGPVKGKVMGDPTEDLVERRDRGTDYMNYQYLEEMPEAFWEMDQLLYRLPFEGSCFKKSWVDPVKGRICQALVTAEDLIVPYTASSLMASPRHAHRIRYYPNDMRKAMASGMYRKVDLADPSDMDEDKTEVEQEIDKSEGRSPNDMRTDRQYEVLEVYCELDLPGFEDVGEDGQPTGIELPYCVTVEKESQKVLAVRRNWKAGDDAQKTKCVYFQHYKFLPGFGFYGHGLLHTIGGLSEAATGSLRALLDAAQLANLRGGFKSKDVKIPGGDTQVAPGEWKDVESTGDDLNKAFHEFRYSEPSRTLFELLGFLVEAGQRFASTTESMVGDAANTGPVGTTVALIEQGSKVFSAIHKRIHAAQAHEFKLIAELNYQILPEGQPYPYHIADAEKHVIRDDFDGRIDWVPVSDPNIISSTQRIAQQQAVLQLIKEAPELYDKYEAHKRMLEALRIEDPDRLLPDPTKRQRLDPVTENMALLHGKPVRAFPDQNHAAHIEVHMTWFASLPKEGQKMLENQLYAHLAEHYMYRQQLEMAIGAPLPFMPDFHAPKGEDIMQELPPHLESAVAVAAAKASKMIAAQAQGQQKPPPEQLETMADIKRKDMESAAEQQRKDAEFAREQERKDVELVADTRRKTVADALQEGERQIREAQRSAADMMRPDGTYQ